MDFINDIKNWLELKIRLWTKKNGVVFKQGEIWWCSKRLTNKIDSVSKADFGKVKKRFIEFYGS